MQTSINISQRVIEDFAALGFTQIVFLFLALKVADSCTSRNMRAELQSMCIHAWLTNLIFEHCRWKHDIKRYFFS